MSPIPSYIVPSLRTQGTARRGEDEGRKGEGGFPLFCFDGLFDVNDIKWRHGTRHWGGGIHHSYCWETKHEPLGRQRLFDCCLCIVASGPDSRSGRRRRRFWPRQQLFQIFELLSNATDHYRWNGWTITLAENSTCTQQGSCGKTQSKAGLEVCSLMND